MKKNEKLWKMIILKIIWAKSINLAYWETQTKACLVEPVLCSPLHYKWRYRIRYRWKKFWVFILKMSARTVNLRTSSRKTRIFKRFSSEFKYHPAVRAVLRAYLNQMGLNLVKYERTYFWTGMPSLSRGGANSDFWGRYAPVKKRPQNPVPLTGQ
jgi:hypothetical protein